MGKPVELTAPAWDEPRPAFRNYRPGFSPYVHIWLDRDPTDGPPPEHPLSSQTEAALREMIERAFGE